ncbi:MAG: hypothetical protein QXU64_05085 [Thermofilaceae archaeon]
MEGWSHAEPLQPAPKGAGAPQGVAIGAEQAPPAERPPETPEPSPEPPAEARGALLRLHAGERERHATAGRSERLIGLGERLQHSQALLALGNT